MVKVLKQIQAIANLLNPQQKVKMKADIDIFLTDFKEGKLRLETEEMVE